MCYETHLSKVCSTVKMCLQCRRIIVGKFVNGHKCDHIKCQNCNKYVKNGHKCFMKRVKLKGGFCTNSKPCNGSKKDWCYSCLTRTQKYVFYDFECTQSTGRHVVNLSVAYDYDGNEYIHNCIEEFCGFL